MAFIYPKIHFPPPKINLNFHFPTQKSFPSYRNQYEFLFPSYKIHFPQSIQMKDPSFLLHTQPLNRNPNP
ncbi:hypothetical protein HanXRQr2_Chr13g0613271 [Helianthus annuus]|uniref:Uncharacterized protein n=1 Tax=Helianthus annuus TaxID=4232 RepID=A0A251SWW6_HELAN|nr:hypothetical protein HanXRQr2_Chr13g0613271 [Helianthus annuus]